MKKYWKLITIATIVVVSIGTFYIQSTLAANNLPQFDIKKHSGDEQEIASLVINGGYQDKSGGSWVWENLYLSAEGSLYSKQQSFFERMDDSYYNSSKLAGLVKDQRNFMRGKGWSNSVLEDEQSVVHVDMTYKFDLGISNKFIISVLNKKTNKKTSFDHTIPKGDTSGWVDIMKIQLMGDQLKVITRNEVNSIDNNQNIEVHVYTFDLTKQTLENDETILSIPNEQKADSYMDTYVLETTGTAKEKSNIAFFKEITTQIMDKEGYVIDESVKRTLIVYDLVKNEYTELDVEEMTEYGYPQFYDGANLYFTDVDPEVGAEINTYSLADKKFIDTLVIDQPEGFHGPHMTMDDGKLYLVNLYKDFQTPAFVTVVDIGAKETLYQGEIVNKDIKEDFKFEVHTIGFK